MSDTLVFPSPILERWRKWDFGAHQRVSAHWAGVAKADPTFRRVYMTVELVFGDGVVVRMARGPLRTTSSIDGAVYEYQQGLAEEPDLDHSLNLTSTAASARSLTFALPADVVDPQAILARGGMLAGVGEVSLQRDGDDYELRLVLLRGDMTGGVAWGASGELVQVAISDPTETQSLLVPAVSIDTDRWPSAQDDVVGSRYPLVINGYPYVPTQRVLDDHGGTGLQFLVCAPGRDLQVGTIYVNGDVAAGGYLPLTETNTVDGKGTAVKVLDASASAGPWEESDTVYVELTRTATTPARSVVQVVQRLLEGYTALGRLGLNPDLFSTADVAMPGYPPRVLINASGSSAVSVMDFVQSTLLSSFPMVFLTYMGRGLGPVVIDRRQRPDGGGIAGRLVAGSWPLLERLVLLSETAKGDLYNSFELRYSYSALDNSYAKVVKRDAGNSVACRLSEAMVGGTRTMDTLDSPYIMADDLANYVIDWLVAHRALPMYYVEWSCVASVLVRYRLGQNVEYSDGAIPVFTSTTAIVVRLTYSRGRPVIGLLVCHPKHQQLLLGAAA